MSRAAVLFAIAGGACGGAAAVKPPPADHQPAPITLAAGERLGLLLRGAEAPYQVTRATPPFAPMPFTLASGPGGMIGHGDQRPKISPDGRWVAEARDGPGTAVTMVRLALPWAGRATATSWLPLARSAARRRCQRSGSAPRSST